MDLSAQGIFNSVSQARQYRELLFLLKNGTDDTLITFLDHVLDELSGPMAGWVLKRKKYLRCLENLIKLFYVRVEDENWINCHQI